MVNDKETIQRWVAGASHCVGDDFDSVLPYLEKGSDYFPEVVRSALANIYVSCLKTSHSMFALISEAEQSYIWDSEMQYRSILDGMLKFFFIMEPPVQQQIERAIEFSITIPDLNAVRRSIKIEPVLASLKDFVSRSSDLEPLRALLLSEAEKQERRNGTNKDDRKKLEQKWSASQIIDYFEHSENPKFKALGMLKYEYAQTNHVIHKDYDGIMTIISQSLRAPETERLFTLMLAARTLSALTNFFSISNNLTFSVLNLSPKPVVAVDSLKYASLMSELKCASEQYSIHEGL